MLKNTLLALAIAIGATSAALAAVDVNKADQAALDGVKGLGPKTSKAILDARKSGEFKDWADFEQRVKGVGGKNAARLAAAGLTVNGKSRSDMPASASASASRDGKQPTAKTATSSQAAAAASK